MRESEEVEQPYLVKRMWLSSSRIWQTGCVRLCVQG